ncbi:hypothetical protein [Roseomonas gilardii]|uniref:hypothetical protein n=1 Tax=Roseomonas gilardii TaxID=257708 RepID=UPI0011A44ACA|nr:hypothetical protein [Roseomonas gilardii]
MAIEQDPRIDLVVPRSPAKRRLVFRAAMAGPRWLWSRSREASGSEEIIRNGRLIQDLAASVRQGPGAPKRIFAGPDGRLDMAATALSHGLTVPALKERMVERRRQTARIAYMAFAGGWLVLGWWLWQALTAPWSGSRIVLGMEFIPFCAVFFLLAFKNAWLNWQLRTGRLGSAMAYLSTAERFWPN